MGKSTPRPFFWNAIQKLLGVTAVTFPKYMLGYKMTYVWHLYLHNQMAAAIQRYCLFFHIDNLKIAYLGFYSR